VDDAELLNRAVEAAEGSYSPYSKFRVGAVVVTNDGDVVSGANIENAAFGASICAEANAISNAIAAGATAIESIAVVCLDGDLCTPCGNCRQIMREFNVQRILLRTSGGATQVLSVEDLLPMSFGPEALES